MFRLFDLSYNMENEKEKWANFRVYFKTLHQAMIEREKQGKDIYRGRENNSRVRVAQEDEEECTPTSPPARPSD